MNIDLLSIFKSQSAFRIKAIKLFDYLIGGLLALLLPSAKSVANIKKDEIKSILIIRPGGIGDAVFLLPILHSLKHTYPQLTITVLCERRNAQVFSIHSSLADHVFCYDRFSEFNHVLKKEYDCIVDSEQWHYLSGLICRWIKAPLKIGFATRPLRAKLFNHPVAYNNNAYELINFKNLFSLLIPENATPDTITGSFETDPASLEWASKNYQKPYTILFVGASIAIRRLTQSQSIDIIQNLFDQGKRIVLIGGKDVLAHSESIHLSVNDERLLNLSGRTNLAQSAALIKNCELFIGPDSGLLHIACALNTPTIGIFGPGNVKKWGTPGDNNKIVTLNLQCSPCTYFGYTIPTCHKQYQCMRTIGKINTVLNKGNQNET